MAPNQMIFTMTHQRIFDLYIDAKSSTKLLVRRIVEALPHLDTYRLSIKKRIQKMFLPVLMRKYQKVNQNRQDFLIKYKSWLEKKFQLVNKAYKAGPIRPKTSYQTYSKRLKQRKMAQLCRAVPAEVILMAAKHLQKTQKKPKRPKKRVKKVSPLRLIQLMRLSRWQYSVVRKAAKEAGANVFPTYDMVLDMKRRVREWRVRAKQAEQNRKLDLAQQQAEENKKLVLLQEKADENRILAELKAQAEEKRRLAFFKQNEDNEKIEGMMSTDAGPSKSPESITGQHLQAIQGTSSGSLNPSFQYSATQINNNDANTITFDNVSTPPYFMNGAYLRRTPGGRAVQSAGSIRVEVNWEKGTMRICDP